MTRILHLSDLHFGRINHALVAPLLRTANALAPDLVAISGDLTQRARVGQFKEAADFIAALEAPVVCVPGNHDTPLDNIFVRMFAPWGRYRRYISHDLEPVVADDRMALVGVNTVNRFAWQRGRVSRRTAARISAGFARLPDHLVRIAMLHHPLEHPPDSDKAVLRGSRRAIAALAESRAQVVLSGHLHNTRVAPLLANPGLLFVQAGTGLSSRLRGGEANMFNLLDFDPDGTVTIERYGASPEGEFAHLETAHFRQGRQGWSQST